MSIGERTPRSMGRISVSLSGVLKTLMMLGCFALAPLPAFSKDLHSEFGECWGQLLYAGQSLMPDRSPISIRKYRKLNNSSDPELRWWELTYVADGGYVDEDRGIGFLRAFLEIQPRRLDVDIIFGHPEYPGLGAFMLQDLRQENPNIPLDGGLGLLNLERLFSALRSSPMEPDFSRVPIIKSIQEDFELELHFGKSAGGGRILYGASIRFHPRPARHPLIPRWINRDAVISSSNFQLWLQSGMKTGDPAPQ